MPDPLLCTRCGSDAVMPRVRVSERGDDNFRYDLEVEVQRRPNAVLYKRPERTILWVQVCGFCGHAELYADAPVALYAAYLQADSSPTVSTLEELERTREAFADSQIRLRERRRSLRSWSNSWSRAARHPSVRRDVDAWPLQPGTPNMRRSSRPIHGVCAPRALFLSAAAQLKRYAVSPCELR